MVSSTRHLLHAEPLLGSLEPAQRAAVLAEEPVVAVLAGAGTGKTRVLTLRVARRIDDGTAQRSHVLVCTFSRKAAEELRERLFDLGVGGDVEAGTLHRTALRLIGRYRAEHGLPAPAVLADRRRLLEELARPGGRAAPRDPGSGARGGRLDAEIGWAKARLIGPADYERAARAAARRPPYPASKVAELYARYEEARRRRGVLDLDDLLVHCVELVESDAAFAAAVRWWHRHLFVDEAQDLNEAQYRFLRALIGDDPDLFVVGDPDQSVYGWNGADPAILERLSQAFPGTRVIRLRENHRCAPQVVDVAVAALGSSATQPSSRRAAGPAPRVARLDDDAEEARWVARQVWLAHRPARRWSSIAVLARTNAQLRLLAAALEAERVPCRVAGSELAPASDVEPRGQRGGAGRLDGEDRDAAAGSSEDGEAPARGTGTEPSPPVTVAPGPGTDAVVLSTFHRAKGLQWPTVFVVGLSDGLIPLVSSRTRAAREEERRLLYVALTRAEDELCCSWAAAGPDGSARRPSPWLASIEAAIDRRRASDDASSADVVAAHLARIRGLLAEVPAAGTGHAVRTGRSEP